MTRYFHVTRMVEQSLTVSVDTTDLKDQGYSQEQIEDMLPNLALEESLSDPYGNWVDSHVSDYCVEGEI